MKKNKNESKITFRLDKELEEKFKNHCKHNGFAISKRLRILMEKDIRQGL